MDEQQTPLSPEVLDHIRRTDYDGQGKSQAKEAEDSMFIVAYAVAGFILAAIVVVIWVALH